jgi:CRP/FNR family transcriptional regulator
MQESNSSELLSKLPFFEKLNQQERELLLSQTTKVTYPKNSVVYSRALECLGVILLTKGCLRTYMLSEQGRDITLYRLYSGDICTLSASCLLNNITFDVMIEAEDECEALLMNTRMFQKLMDSNVYVENFSYKSTIDRFSDVMWTMEQILFMSFDQRLSVFLLDEATKTKSDTIKLTHAQIAKYIGSAREVVSRMLKRFESDGLVQLTRGGIVLLDKKRLRM